jgi:hypothetical protein
MKALDVEGNVCPWIDEHTPIEEDRLQHQKQNAHSTGSYFRAASGGPHGAGDGAKCSGRQNLHVTKSYASYGLLECNFTIKKTASKHLYCQ